MVEKKIAHTSTSLKLLRFLIQFSTKSAAEIKSTIYIGDKMRDWDFFQSKKLFPRWKNVTLGHLPMYMYMCIASPKAAK